jgi:hypothetical protein
LSTKFKCSLVFSAGLVVTALVFAVITNPGEMAIKEVVYEREYEPPDPFCSDPIVLTFRDEGGNLVSTGGERDKHYNFFAFSIYVYREFPFPWNQPRKKSYYFCAFHSVNRVYSSGGE